jgi:hypothetical protein
MNEFIPTTDPGPARPGCEPARAALQRLLDGDVDWDGPDAAGHRVSCVDCREELALARSLAREVRAAVVPIDLAGKVLSAAVTDRRRRPVRRYASVSGVLAASVLVAVMVLHPAPQTVSETPTFAAATRKSEPSAQSKPLGEAVSEARDALVSLTRRTATETRDSSTSLIPNPKLSDKPIASSGLEPLADAQAGASRSVEPIRSSARRALNLFLRAADPPNKPALQ